MYPSNWRPILMSLLLGLTHVQAQAADDEAGRRDSGWSAQPRLVEARGFNRSLKLLQPLGVSIESATVLPSVEEADSLLQVAVPLKEGKLAVRTLNPKRGGYYRVVAQQQTAAELRVASTVVYFSNPGPAPRAMLAAEVAPLELVPVELPREHRHYREGEQWEFQLRERGRPVPAHRVILETEQGTREVLTTDADGVIAVVFPADIPTPSEDEHEDHRHARAASGFVLSAERETVDGRTTVTAFNQEYEVGPYVGKNVWLGGGFALLGMLSATPLVRRRARKGGAA